MRRGGKRRGRARWARWARPARPTRPARPASPAGPAGRQHRRRRRKASAASAMQGHRGHSAPMCPCAHAEQCRCCCAAGEPPQQVLASLYLHPRLYGLPRRETTALGSRRNGVSLRARPIAPPAPVEVAASWRHARQLDLCRAQSWLSSWPSPPPGRPQRRQHAVFARAVGRLAPLARVAMPRYIAARGRASTQAGVQANGSFPARVSTSASSSRREGVAKRESTNAAIPMPAGRSTPLHTAWPAGISLGKPAALLQVAAHPHHSTVL